MYENVNQLTAAQYVSDCIPNASSQLYSWSATHFESDSGVGSDSESASALVDLSSKSTTISLEGG